MAISQNEILNGNAMNKFEIGDYVAVTHVTDYDVEEGVSVGDVLQVLEANDYDILTTCEKALFTDQIVRVEFEQLPKLNSDSVSVLTQ